MASCLQDMEALIKRLNAIAKKNHDEFKYYIELDVLRDGKIRYTFCADETADGHAIAGGAGTTIEEAVSKTNENIPEFIKARGYKE